MKHIDDFIDDFQEPKYPRWFFHLHRLPAILQADFSEWMKEYKLFCDYKGHQYRVTGCSRMGDVWITNNFERDCGYDKRVDVTECLNWRDKP